MSRPTHGTVAGWLLAAFVLVALALMYAMGNAAQAGQTADATSSSQAGAQSGSAAGAAVLIDSHAVTTNTANIPKAPVFSPASLMLNSCQEGATGQSFSGGAASGFESPTCTALRSADANQKLWLLYEARGDMAQAKMHHDRMEAAMADADEAQNLLHYPKTVGSAFVSVLPVGLLFLLF